MRWTKAALGALTLVTAGAVGLVVQEARGDIGDLVGTKPGDPFAPFLDADTCNNCHGKGVMGDKSFLPADTWAGTMMANASRDPVFFAALTVANQDQAGVGSYCLHCHSPIGFVRGHATPAGGSAFDAIDKQGVGCETCHRAVTSNVTPDPYVISDAQLFYDGVDAKHGPYVSCDAPNAPADCAQSPAHEVVNEPNLASSTFCGQCHQVTNPGRKMKDAAGVDTAFEFPLDTTYDEWKQSSFAAGASAQSCQDCHMVRKTGDYPVTSIFGSPLRHDPRTHAFVGGNHWGIQAVMNANPDRVAMFGDAFQLAQDKTLETLGKSVAVTLTGAPASGKAGDKFDVKVKVENLTGHKFPTGYAETRRAWIAIVLTGGGASDDFLFGGYDAGTGEILGAADTHVYRAVHGKWNGTAGVPESHLVQHDMVLEDTRIPPLGFTATETTKIIGAIPYTDGAGKIVNFDEKTFSVTLPAGFAGAANLSARVYYQSMTKEYVDFLESENTTDTKGHDLATIYDATDQAPPIEIAHADAAIEFPPMPTGAGGAGTTSASSASSSTTGAGGGGADGGDGGGCDCSLTDDHSAGGAAAGALSGLLGLAAWLGRRRPRGVRAR
ncbi:MAG: multiheme c-type cytochrome [Polyangiaceae bacterium]